jgi:inosose dehydratase
VIQKTSRRAFLAGFGAVAAAEVMPRAEARATAKDLQFGYAAITWGDGVRQAIDDIAALGFRGIQFRANVVDKFKPAELRDLLQTHNLKFTALSSGDVVLDANPADEIARHVANAQYVKDCGGLYLQLLDKLQSHPRRTTPAECVQLGKLMSEIGKRAADLGVTVGYHNHLNSLSETPAGLAMVLNAADSRYVRLELDTAHAAAGGGDPARLIEKYRDRLLFLHLKDLVDQPGAGKYPFQFVELGRGRVDIPAVFSALYEVNYHGWVVVELDRVPGEARTPKESALISRTYLEQKLGVEF